MTALPNERLSKNEWLAKVKAPKPKDTFDPRTALPVDVADRINAECDSKIKQYPHVLAVHVVDSAAWWAGPLIAIYLLGVGIAWIRVGFRRN